MLRAAIALPVQLPWRSSNARGRRPHPARFPDFGPSPIVFISRGPSRPPPRRRPDAYSQPRTLRARTCFGLLSSPPRTPPRSSARRRPCQLPPPPGAQPRSLTLRSRRAAPGGLASGQRSCVPTATPPIPPGRPSDSRSATVLVPPHRTTVPGTTAHRAGHLGHLGPLGLPRPRRSRPARGPRCSRPGVVEPRASRPSCPSSARPPGPGRRRLRASRPRAFHRRPLKLLGTDSTGRCASLGQARTRMPGDQSVCGTAAGGGSILPLLCIAAARLPPARARSSPPVVSIACSRGQRADDQIVTSP
jgi:hypothetical protein